MRELKKEECHQMNIALYNIGKELQAQGCPHGQFTLPENPEQPVTPVPAPSSVSKRCYDAGRNAGITNSDYDSSGCLDYDYSNGYNAGIKESSYGSNGEEAPIPRAPVGLNAAGYYAGYKDGIARSHYILSNSRDESVGYNVGWNAGIKNLVKTP